ncbi:GTP cyclohydrolase I [Streptomyces sp. NPDC049879]|uniref:GTP cyclohydrolase I n=1 Tax=Streptomyces sp. NPDC049879 TaxID=3365598 RepID=UPI0037917211
MTISTPARALDDVRTDLRTTAEAGVAAALRLVGDDPTRDGLEKTAARWVRALEDLCTPPGPTPAEALAVKFPAGAVDQMVAVGPLPFTSLCEHHLMTITGRAWIAYLPHDGQVVGLSKIPRVLDWVAARPQLQERMTQEVVQSLVDHNGPDAACVIEAAHGCMSSRGVKKSGAVMRTQALAGRFLENAPTRAEFLTMIGPMG